MRNTDLTPREEEVAFLAGQGLTDIEIARKLGIRPHTVAGYWLRMRLKLGVASRTAVTAIYTEHKARQYAQSQDGRPTREGDGGTEDQPREKLEDRLRRRTAQLEKTNRELRAKLAKLKEARESDSKPNPWTNTLAAAGVGVFEVDYATGAIHRIVGKPGAFIPGVETAWELIAKLEEVCHPEDLDRVRAVAESTMADPPSEIDLEWRLRGADGAYRDIVSKGALERGPDGKPKHFVCVFADVTQARKTEEQRNRFYSEMNELMAVLTTDGEFVQINPAGLKVLGFKRGAIIGTRAVDHVQPAQRESFQAKWDWLITSGHAETLEFRMKRADGGYSCMLAAATVGTDGMVYLTALDTSRRRMAEEAVAAGERKLRRLFEQATDGFFVTAPDGTILDVNRKGVEVLGYDSKQDLFEHNFERDLYAVPGERARVLAFVDKAGNGEFEIDFRRKSGAIVTTQCSVTAERDDLGKTLSYHAILRDITERKNMEKALRESEERYRQVFEHATDGLFLVEVEEDGRLRNLDTNPAFAAMTGISRSATESYYLHEVIPKGFADDVLASFRQCIETGVVIERERTCEFPAGVLSYRDVLIPIRNASGKVDRIVGMIRKTTEQMKAAEEVRRANVELEDRVAERSAQLRAADREKDELKESVRASLRRTTAILENITDAFGALDRDFQFTFVNSTAARIMNVDPERVIGASAWEVWPAGDEWPFEAKFRQAMNGADVKFEAFSPAPIGRWLELRCYAAEEGLSVFFTDVTERKGDEERIRTQAALLSAINKVLRQVPACESEREIAERCLSVARQLTGSQSGVIALEDRQDVLRTLAADEAWIEMCGATSKSAPAELADLACHPLWGRLLAEGKPQIVNVSAPQGPEGPVAERFLGFPLTRADRVIGFIGLANKLQPYTQADLDAIEALSIAVVETLDRMRAEADVRELNNRLNSVLPTT